MYPAKDLARQSPGIETAQDNATYLHKTPPRTVSGSGAPTTCQVMPAFAPSCRTRERRLLLGPTPRPSMARRWED